MGHGASFLQYAQDGPTFAEVSEMGEPAGGDLGGPYIARDEETYPLRPGPGSKFPFRRFGFGFVATLFRSVTPAKTEKLRALP